MPTAEYFRLVIQLYSMQSQTYFQTATFLFYQNKLQQALMAITRSIDLKSTNSISYNNRALINYHLTKLDQAKEDLSMALSLNPLNYAAYFNLASIQLRSDNFEGFFQNIECGIASLRLIYGRKKKQKKQVMASIEACPNNIDALILLLLMEVQRQNFKEASKIIEKYETIQRDKVMMKRIRNNVESMVNQYSIQKEEQFYELLQLDFNKGRLQCSKEIYIKLAEEINFQKAIEKKLEEFNKYYKLVNNLIGKVKHIPKNHEKQGLIENLKICLGKSNCVIEPPMITSH